ncbi:MAG: hypothetical protein OXH79_10055 [Boseongicola sp.]|nr:hypothetical protein [Boseongicola sp.]
MSRHGGRVSWQLKDNFGKTSIKGGVGGVLDAALADLGRLGACGKFRLP